MFTSMNERGWIAWEAIIALLLVFFFMTTCIPSVTTLQKQLVLKKERLEEVKVQYANTVRHAR
ncbi:hypothetical protein GOP80_09090 [Planococcaceae bacterium Storch 2/2-2]|nr:hypothetical protein [Planococcaceae bacterium Storch 2/2-2]